MRTKAFRSAPAHHPFFSAKTVGSVLTRFTRGTCALFDRSQGRFGVPRDTSSATAKRQRPTRLVTALFVFACAWSAQRADIAQAQGLTLGPAPEQSSEFLLHASPDNIQEIAVRHGLTIVRTIDVPPYGVFLVRAASASTSAFGSTTDGTPEDK